MTTPDQRQQPQPQPQPSDMYIPDPQDILTVIDSFDAHIPPEITNPIERMSRPYEVILRAGYTEVRRILLYAYYCSLRDNYDRR